MGNHHRTSWVGFGPIAAAETASLPTDDPSRSPDRQGTKKASCTLHRLVTNCGKLPADDTTAGVSPLSRTSGASRRKAPRVLPISALFAELRGTRALGPGRVGCASGLSFRPRRARQRISCKRAATSDARFVGASRVLQVGSQARLELRAGRRGRPAQAGRTGVRRSVSERRLRCTVWGLRDGIVLIVASAVNSAEAARSSMSDHPSDIGATP
jgi:hypothetical protein